MAKMRDKFNKLLAERKLERSTLVELAVEETGVDKSIVEKSLEKEIANRKFIEHNGYILPAEYVKDIEVPLESYSKLMELMHRDGYRYKGSNSHMYSAGKEKQFMEYTIYTLEKDGKEKRIRVEDNAGFLYAFKHQTLPDDLDGSVPIKIDDKGKYYDEMEKLFENFDEKVKAAIEKIQKGESEIIGEPFYEELLEEFLLTPKAVYQHKFLPLKEHFHEIFAAHVLEAQHYLEIYRTAKEKNKLVNKYGGILDELAKVFFTAEPPMKNFRTFRSYVTTQPTRFAETASLQSEYIDFQHKAGVKLSPLSIKIGFLQMLDMYRRFCELVRNPVRDIRKIVELKQDVEISSGQRNYDEDIAIINGYDAVAPLMEPIVPIVRHAESHLFTQIDEDAQQIVIEDESTKEKFTFDMRDLDNKRHEIQAGLVPALLGFYAGTDIALKLITMRSPGFLLRLVLVGNTKK